MKKCVKCASPLNDNDRFCPICGADQVIGKGTTTNYCVYCGAPIENDSKYCMECGMQLDNFQTQNQKKEKTTTLSSAITDQLSKRFEYSGIMLIVCGGVWLAFSLLIVLYYKLYVPKYNDFSIIIFVVNGIVISAFFFILAMSHLKFSKKIIQGTGNCFISSINKSIFCAVMVVIVVALEINTKNIFGIIFLLLSIGIASVEFIYIFLFVMKHKEELCVLDKQHKDQVERERIEALRDKPSKWDSMINYQEVESIDENNQFYKMYCGFRKEQLIEILENPYEYQEEAIKTARYVFKQKFGE